MPSDIPRQFELDIVDGILNLEGICDSGQVYFISLISSLTHQDRIVDNREVTYDPDMPGKTLDEYMASWDELIREVRDNE